MTTSDHRLVRLEFTSAFDMLDLVQTVGDNICGDFGFDEDTAHWISVSVRECVINAIKHGNQNDSGKRVWVEFETNAQELLIRVRDQGEGFDPEEVADPLATENLLKSSGRGIFLIRNFMDDVRLQRMPQGGMEIQMTKRISPTAPADPVKT
jgi:serine/threonine-protein kinase RsbW